MTPEEWADYVFEELVQERRAGNSINTAAAEALASLHRGWEESIKQDGISPRVCNHDLLEVAKRLLALHREFKRNLPGVLDEIVHALDADEQKQQDDQWIKVHDELG
jgi:hypothetical protein